MITKYRTGGWGNNPIQKVEVERETEVSVWINGCRSAKTTEYSKYFDSWCDARDHLMNTAQNRLDSCRRSLEQAQGAYGNIKGLKNPD